MEHLAPYPCHRATAAGRGHIPAGRPAALQSLLRDIVDLMRKNETSFPHFRNSNTYKLFEPPVFENKKRASGYFF